VACEAERNAFRAAERRLFRLEARCDGGHLPSCAAIPQAELAYERALSDLEACEARQPSNLAIAGIERTQAIQFFLFNGQGSGFAGNNSVPLVADKALILRVYVNRTSTPGVPIPATVTGRVTFAGSPPIAPINGPIAAAPSTAINRGNANHTLNFLIPPSRCRGSVTFTVTVFEPGHEGEPAYSSAPLTFTVSFGTVPLVRIHGVLIHYTGLGLDIAAPTGLDLVNTLLFVFKTYPIGGFNYTGCEVADFNGDLRVGGGGGCGTGWNQLFNMVSNMRTASGTTDVYVGLLPAGVPTSGVIGCGGGGVALGYVGDGPTMAQEIGHAFGRAHAPCGNPGGPDPNYPTYDMFPSGSIGEFGFDTLTSQVFNPATTFDFMSYCGPVWVSPYTYTGLKSGITSAPAAAHPERPETRDAKGEYLQLNFRIHADGQVELLPSFHLEGLVPTREIGPATPVRCDLLGPDDRILETHRCHLTDPHQDPDAPELVLHELVPWHPETRAIVFRRHGEVCHREEVEEPPPEITLKAPKRAGDREEVMRLEWKPARREPSLTYLVRYSHDGGATWRAVAADLTEPRSAVNLDLLPGGDDCRFQVVASRGIRTTVTESDPFAVPVKPVQAQVLDPRPDAVYREGEAVVLRGGGFSPDHETTRFDEVSWSSSVDGHLGVGYEHAVTTLSPGRHRITLSVPDGLGGEATSAVFIEVRPAD
jgi:hypothetical protein